jgi:glycosyltransferase involved in cell wall biosynthesis
MIFFQNNEDLHYFRYKKIVSKDFSDLLPGSGINLNIFSYSSYPRYPDSKFKFLMASRLLWSKGIREYFEAANYVNKIYPDVEFCLLGIFEDLNPQSVKLCNIEELKKTSSVNFLSGVSDITSYISKSSCIVLPSYYPEGTPRFLLEAAAMGRPVITTNLKGCRDVVDDNVTGLLCLPNSISDLADKMIKMINYDFEQRVTMGLKARKKMEKEFDVALVCQKYMDVIKMIG